MTKNHQLDLCHQVWTTIFNIIDGPEGGQIAGRAADICEKIVAQLLAERNHNEPVVTPMDYSVTIKTVPCGDDIEEFTSACRVSIDDIGLLID